MRNNIITVKYNEYSGKFTVKPAVYQWDYGLIMQINGLELPEVTEWHFGNGEKTVKAIGDATNVSIPDECLEKTGDLQVYYFGHTKESDGETVYHFTIPVLKRLKPSDITPIPVQQDIITQTIAVLQTETGKVETAAIEAKEAAQKAEEAAASIDEEMISEAVSDYLDDHPITVTEEDPTVPSWAKQPTKPAYTAQEVGAVSTEELPDAIDIALAQAKESGEFDGKDGQDGQDGLDGQDGYSPSASVTKLDNATTISITDKDGTTTATVMDGQDGYTPIKGVDYFDGQDGQPGDDGYSPSASVTKSEHTSTITITDKNGTTTAQVTDGQDGDDGVSPSVSVTTITGGHRVAVTDADGTNTFDIMDGQNGQEGFSPIASVTKSGNTATVTITDNDGTTTAQINDGQDGFSPTANVSKSGTVTTITVTDKDGTTTAQVTDGQDGEDGEPGVYIGPTAPSNPDVSVWIDTSGEGDVINVPGTDVTITGVANTRYICEEVSTISITPPASGTIDVIFTSGSSVALLTVPSTVKWPSGFDPTSLEANMTYELNIMDGVYGVAMAWT